MDYIKALEILGATSTDDEKTLKDKYYAKMREVHPDHGGSNEAAIEVQTAYNMLLDPPLTELESILFDMISSGNEVTLDDVGIFFKRIIGECTYKIVSLNAKHKSIDKSSKRFSKSSITFKKKIEQELSKLSHQISMMTERREAIEKIKKEFEETYNSQECEPFPVRPAFPKSNSLWVPT
jgi:curved DNA-binding protein CbpA